MSSRPMLSLSKLRDIGWSLWDPIGLMVETEDWRKLPNADEYDSYLIRVAGMIRRGGKIQDAVEYLIWVESEHMGLENAVDIEERATAVVNAIRDNELLWSRASNRNIVG